MPRTTATLVDHLRTKGAVVAVVAQHTDTSLGTIVSLANAKSTARTTSGPNIRLRGYPLPFNPELSIVYPVRLSSLYRRTFGSAPDLIYLD